MNSSGLGNYSRTLIKSLIENFPENEYVAFTPTVKESLGKKILKTGKLELVLPPQLMRSVLSSWWRSSFISQDIRVQKLDVYHGLSNELPKRIPKETKKVVTIHDLIFLRQPEWYPLIDRNTYYRKCRFACKEADAIVAVSEQTKKDIQYYFNTDTAKIKVVYQSCDEFFYVRAEDFILEDFRKRKNLPEKYILYVGTVEERKNLLTLVKAMTKVSDVPLVVIGRKKKYFEKVQEFMARNKVQSKIIFPDSSFANDLSLYYKCASVFVYPSYYEGFGIPVIEALLSGVPVITSNTSALPEAGGISSLYVNPHDEGDLAEKINSVLNNEVLRKKMVADGSEYVKRFHPKTTSSEMMNLYKTISG